MNPLIYVDLIHTPEPDGYRDKNPNGRWQAYSLKVKSGDNNKVLFKSTEAYTNRDDAIHAAAIAFGPASNVYLREAEQGNLALRLTDAAHAANIQPFEDDGDDEPSDDAT